MADALETGPIPETPPTGATSKPQLAMKVIAALKAECDAKGLTSRYAKCAILAVIGGECGWIPIKELYPHSLSQLTGASNIFGRSRDATESAQFCKGNNKTRLEYFGWLYGTSWKPPLPVSNGNYYGRGLIQLTHKENYQRYGKLIGIDLVSNPDLLADQSDAGIDANVKYVVAYMQDRISGWNEAQWKPGFIERVLKAVGGSKHGWNKKRGYNEYFLGGKPASAPTNKDPSSTTIDKTPKEIDNAPANKREAYTEDRTSNFNTNGFTDPEGKYPLRDYMNEPDTNRLARGIIDGTHVNFKDSTRKLGIPTAMGSSYDQPQSAYNTVYPLNKVFESESGHVLEFDDSPDGERINLYHSKGTFIEIDPNGSQINYIVGDGFYITENNGNIFINGTCNVTSSGPMNILCQGNAQIEVDGQSDIVLHNHANIGVALDLNIAVGGDMNILVEGNYNLEVGKTSNMRTIGTMSLESNDALKLKTAKSMSMEGGDTASTAETLMKMSSSFKLETPADFQIKAKTFTLDIAEATSIKTGSFKTQTLTGNLELQSVGTAVLNAPSIISMTAAKIDLNGTKIDITDINPLQLLGSSKKPVDFAGNEVEDRKEEQVLVDTVLNPAGDHNPVTLPHPLMDSILNNIPLKGYFLRSFGSSIPDLYDKKYAVTTVESKTSLSAAGIQSKRNIVPSVDGPHQEFSENLVPPQRYSESTSKYETEEEWASAGGQKLQNKISSTSDYEHNHVEPTAEDTATPTGGKSGGTTIAKEKLDDINGRDDFPLSYKLSEHFTLGMLCTDGNLQEQTISGTLYTKANIVANLSELSENILEKIYSELGPCRGGGSGAVWRISDGFRPNNRKGSKGSKTSHHLKGRAVDIQLVSPNKIPELYDLCVRLEKVLPYQECFMEYANAGRSRWIHLAYDKNNSSKEVTTQVQWKKRSNKIEKLYS